MSAEKRRVNVAGAATEPLDVPADWHLARICQEVAKIYRLPDTTSIRMLVDRKPADSLQQPPPENAIVTALIQTRQQPADGVKIGRVSITPKPIIMHQDMEGFTVVVALAEILDNSIRANAQHVAVQLQQASGGAVTGLVCTDDGGGMAYETAINHMRLAHTDSGIVTAVRERGLPLAAAQYFSRELSRHGKGAAALLYFGGKVTTISKLALEVAPVKVALDYEDWLEEYRSKGTCSYGIDVFEYYDMTRDEDSSFTDIIINGLKPDVAVQLADIRLKKQWAHEVADLYHFFIKGFPKELWDTLPEVLRPTKGIVAGTGRPQGGLHLDLFGQEISQETALPAAGPKPKLATLLDTFLQLQEEFGTAGGKPKLMPFWLPVRWCEPGMHPDEVPTNVTVMRGYAGDADKNGPAGKLCGVHRDFLVLMLYFPYQDGLRTKPDLSEGGVEDLLHSVWCGRLIPKAASSTLPPLVEAARQSGQPGVFKLSSSRMCAVVFCSSEVYTSNHKTELLDEAHDAVLRRLGSKEDTLGDLWAWNARLQRWMAAAKASTLLIQHFKDFWGSLERDGEVLNGQSNGRTGELIGKEFKMPDRAHTLKAGQLVRLLSPKELQEAEPTSSSRGGATGPSHGGTPASHTKRFGQASGRPVPVPASSDAKDYKVIVHFIDRGHFADGVRIYAAVKDWVPSWASSGYLPSQQKVDVALCSPLAATDVEVERVARKLTDGWEAQAPQRLAWWDSAKKKEGQVVFDVTHVTGVPGESRILLAQVPLSLTVCFATAKGKLATLERGKWGSKMSLGSDIDICYEIFQDNRRISPRENHIRYTQRNKAVLDELQKQLSVSGPGKYRVVFTAPKTWIPEPLVYEFEVLSDQPAKLVARWQASGTRAGPPKKRLTEELPTLEITAKGHDNQGLALPFQSPNEAAKALSLTISSTDAPASISFTLPEVVLTGDKRVLKLKGWSLKPQKLRDNRVDARVDVQLAAAYGTLSLDDADQAPLLCVLSGPPAKLVADRLGATYDHPEEQPYSGAENSRGSRVLKAKLLMLDASGNKPFMEAKEEFCARLRFEPDNAATHSSALGVLESPAPPAGAASAGGARRRNSAATAAAAAAAVARSWPVRVDGNVVEILDDFIWLLPPGAGPAAVVVEVFRGKAPPVDRNAEPLLAHTGWYSMQRVHTVVEHPTLERETHPHRWRIWDNREQYDWSQVNTFELNTGDFDSGFRREVLQNRDANVPLEVVRRFTLGYELRQDVSGGYLMNVFVTPSGKVLRGKSPSEVGPSRLPLALVRHWNSLLGERLFYETVFVVPAAMQDLTGVAVSVCNEDDKYDLDFLATVQVLLWQQDGSCIKVLPAEGSSLKVQKSKLHLPPIPIRSDMFTAANQSTATLVVMDVDPLSAAASGAGGQQRVRWSGQQQELGRFHLRLAPAAERLLVMAAGPLFEGSVVRVQEEGRGPIDKMLQLQQDQARSAGSSRQAAGAASASQGAWRPWHATPVAVHGKAVGRGQVEAIDPRSMQLQAPLNVQLGRLITLHFVATDLMGFPVELSEEQRQAVSRDGVLRLLPGEGAGAARLQLEDVRWQWGSSSGATGSTGAPADAEQLQGHLGGPFVNSVSFKLQKGCGLVQLQMQLCGSFGRVSTLQVPLLVEAGPVAVDGLVLQRLTMEQPAAAAAPGTLNLQCKLAGIVDRRTGELLQQPAAAPEALAAAAAAALAANTGPAEQQGTAAAVYVKQEPGTDLDGAAQLHAAQQQQQGDAEVVDLTGLLTSDEEMSEEPEQLIELDDGLHEALQRQRQLSAHEQLLASLSPSEAALLYELQHAPQLIKEGSVLRLQLQLYDSDKHEIGADKVGKLQLRRLKQEEEGSNAEAAWKVLAESDITEGQAHLALQLGVGDDWCTTHLLEIVPAKLPQGSELASTLPLRLAIQVVPGPFPHRLQLATDSLLQPAAADWAQQAAAADGLVAVVSASEAAATVCDAALLQRDSLLDVNLLSSSSGSPSGTQVLLLPPISNSDSAAPPKLPPMAVSIAARDGSTLLPMHLQSLQLQLQRWLPPTTADYGYAEALHTTVSGSWQDVSGKSGNVAAVLLHKQRAEDQQQQQRRQGSEADAMTLFELDGRVRELPKVAGIYQLTAVYEHQQLPVVAPLKVGPFLLLPGSPYKMLRATEAAAAGLQQEERQPASRAPASGRGRGRRQSAGRHRASGGASSTTSGGVGASQASGPAEQVVLLQNLANTKVPQQHLVLQDKWGNLWRPAVARLSSSKSSGRDGSHRSDGRGPNASGSHTHGSTTQFCEPSTAGQADSPQQQHQASRLSNEDGEDALAGYSPGYKEFLRALGQELERPVQVVQQREREANQPPAKRQRTGRDSVAARSKPSAAAAAAAAGADEDSDGGEEALNQPAQQWHVQLTLLKQQAHNGQQQQQQQPAARQVGVFDFDADGVCTMQTRSLEELGIDSVGEWQLHALAVQAAAAAGGSSGQQQPQEQMHLLLGCWRVASEGTAELVSRSRDIKQRLRSLDTAAKVAKNAINGKQQALRVLKGRLETMQTTASRTDSEAQQHQDNMRRSPALQQLYEQVQVAAQQFEVLGRAGQSGQVLGPRLLLRPCQPRRLGKIQDMVIQTLLPDDVANLHEAADGPLVLGPLACLASVECADVAKCLSAFLGRDMAGLVCPSRAAHDRLKQKGKDYLNLGQPELVRYYAVPTRQQLLPQQAWLQEHPQQLIPPSQRVQELLRGVVDWNAYNPDQGFVGFGVNLLHLTPEQLAYRQQVSARQDRNGRLIFNSRGQLALGLRHTLWHFKLVNVLVFETEAHIDKLRQRLRELNRTVEPGVKIVALDMATFNVKFGYEGFKLSPAQLEFSVASPAANDNPLDLRLRYFQSMVQRRDDASTRSRQEREQLQQLQQQIQQVEQDLAAAQEEQAAAEGQKAQQAPQLAKELDDIEQEITLLQGAG